MSGYAHSESLVDTQWVAEHLDNPGVRLVEIVWGTSAAWGRLTYEAGHIPGAVAWDFEQDIQDPVRRDVLDKVGLETLLSRSGFTPETTIILYSGLNNLLATFAFWLLKIFGHGDVRLLDGDRQKWLDENRPTTSQVPVIAPTAYQAHEPNWNLRASRNHVLQSLGKEHHLIIDARPTEMYSGADKAGTERGGHIPGAINLAAQRETNIDGSFKAWRVPTVRQDGTFKPVEELQVLFDGLGVAPDKDIITYCVRGGLSTHAWFVLTQLLGYPNVREYDRSWAEWGNTVGMPTEVPLISPRLAALQQELEAGNAAALDAFWQEVKEQSTPLLEPVPDDARNLRVTFLWRATEETQSVALVSNLSGQMGASETMTRMPGTDLWYKTYKLPNDTRESYQFAVAGINRTDSRNPRKHIFPSDPEVGLAGWESSAIELPAAPPQPWSAPRPGVSPGHVTLHRIRSDILDNEYRVWVYTPPNYATDGAPYGWLLVFDGWFYINLIPTPTLLDNLLADGLLPPLAAILVGHPFDTYRRRDLACYPPFEDFLMREIVPWARQNYHLASDPAQTAVVGASLGGMMAAYIGLRHSDLFGNVLAQSAYFGWKPKEDDEDEWIMRQYVASPKLPLRFSIEAGLFETDIPSPLPGFKNLLVSARHARNVLRAKGYTVHYSEFSGGHNPMNWQGTLANGLLALLGQGPHQESEIM